MRQSANIRGDGSIIVQIMGSDNKVDLGRAHLTLIPWTRKVRSREVESEADLLTPYRRATKFAGREREMESLIAWAQSDRPIAVRLITGKGGAGKTRLAIELMTELCALPNCHWQAGLIASDEMARFASQQNLADWGWQADTLAVLDYAAAASDQISTWLKQLADARDDCGGRFRLLLVEREADAQQGWWESLIALGRRERYERLQDIFDPREPFALNPLSDLHDRWAVLDSTIEAAALRLNKQRPKLPKPGESEPFDRQLCQLLWGRPLFLMMAGLCALERDVVEVLSMNRAELVERVAGREVQRLGDFAPNEHVRKLVVHMAACSTLCRGFSGEDAVRVAKGESKSLGFEWPGGPAALVDTLRNALPGPDGGIGFIEPDIIGEAVVLRALGDLSPDMQKAVVLRAAGSAPSAVPACLVRLVQDFPGARGELPMRWLEALVEAGAADDPGLIRAIADAMPEETVQLRIQAVRVTQLLLERASGRSEADTAPESLAVKSSLLNDLGVRLSAIGRREDALDRSQQAVDIYGRLAESNPDAFLPYLAGSLNNLANALRAVGRREDALEAAQRAVDIYGRLAESNPDAFLPYLAASLNNLATMLSDVGRREDALDRSQQAVDIYRRLAESNPDAFLADFATSLNNLANRLSDVGRREDALEKAQQAVDIHGRLAESNPDAFLPDLAMSLAVRGRCRRAVGDHGGARESFADALKALHKPLSRLPAGFMRLATAMTSDYIQSAKDSGVEPDMDLLRPVVSILQQYANQGESHE